MSEATAIPRVDLRAVAKDWPVASRAEAVGCREGGRRCCRCQAMMDAGVNPYTMEPLGWGAGNE